MMDGLQEAMKRHERNVQISKIGKGKSPYKEKRQNEGEKKVQKLLHESWS